MILPPDAGASKAAWRVHARRTAHIPTPSQIAQVVERLIEFLTPINGVFLFYRAVGPEVPLDGVADALGWPRFAVTRTPDEGPLTVHPAIGPMERHRFGFHQPLADAIELAPHHLSAALVPGMLFDRSGTRLGHGAGYFDELLSTLPPDRPRIGITLAGRIVDRLPVEPHDVPMTHLATESGVTPI